MLKGMGSIKLNIAKTYKGSDDGIYVIGTDQKSVKIVPQTTIVASVVLTDYRDFWNSIKVKILESNGGLYNKTLAQLTKNTASPTITLDNVSADPYATILQFFTTKETLNFIKTELGQHDLKVLDQIRDVILHAKGNETLTITGTSFGAENNGSAELSTFINDIILANPTN